METNRHNDEQENRQRFRRRLLIRMLSLKASLLLFFAIVAGRLIQIQVLDAEMYSAIGRDQYEVRVGLHATRGSIYDRQGRLLVSDNMKISFAADPTIVGSGAEGIAHLFSQTFGKPVTHYLEKLKSREKEFVYLERRVDLHYGKRINASSHPGLIQLNEPQRLYPYDRLAAQVIGFTSIDNEGLSGVELEFEDHLRGTDGYVVLQRDGLGRVHPSVDYPRQDPVHGRSIQLTIDIELQAIVEEELKNGVERVGATSGLALLQDPSTGEILALAHYPSFNPANASSMDPWVMKNRAITDMFEPGSMFKLVTVSAALEHDVVDTSTTFSGENGEYVVTFGSGERRTIRDTHPVGQIGIREAMELSSNIVMAKISDRVGTERLYTMARDYGFGTATGIELPGEIRGELKKPTQWSGTTLNTMAIGYEVGVTPIQIAAAYCAAANNGILMRPFILRRLISDHGEEIEVVHPQSIRKVVKGSTAAEVRRYLQGAVERGTGTMANVDAVHVAGKTGTARKVVDGRYQSGSYTSSFVGFFPAEKPAVVCLVMLDNPKVGGYTGGFTSAPIFRDIVTKIVATSTKFAPAVALSIGKRRMFVPDVTTLQASVATEILEARGFAVDLRGGGQTVSRQTPGAGERIVQGETIRIETGAETTVLPAGVTVVPNVRGMTIRRAMNQLKLHHLNIQLEGSGIVVRQYPSPGARARRGSSVVVRCSPRQANITAL